MDSNSIQPAIMFSNLAEKSAKAYTDAVIAALPKGVVYKGAVSYYTDLPQSGQELGDCYTVKYKGTSGTISDGTEYAWGVYDNIAQWIPLGKEISILFNQTTLVINA